MDHGPSQIGRPGRRGVWTRIRINPVGLTLFPLGFALIFTTFALDASNATYSGPAPAASGELL
jgi:hypothetical protein